MNENKVLPPEIANHLKTWRRSATVWQFTLLSLAIGGIVCALAVTGFVDTLGFFWTRVLAFVSAASFSLVGGLNIAAVAANYRSAWRHLNAACMRYKRDSLSDAQLIEAYEVGERMIGHYEISAEARGLGEHSAKCHRPP